MTRSSRYGSLLVLAALARAVTGCAGTADGEIPCVEDVTCPDQFPVCGSAGKCIAGSSSEKATVAIVGPEGYMPAEFVAGTVRLLVTARATTGVASVKLASGSTNFAASA